VPIQAELDPEARTPTSYSKQYDDLMKEHPLNTKQTIPKPSKEAQAQEPGSKKILLSDVFTIGKRNLFTNRKWNGVDVQYAAFLGAMHVLACFAPFTFSMPMLYGALAMYFVSGCLGITLSYHRQLSHRSFQTPKWLEYALAYCGVLAIQGDPLEWVSSHRYHHLHTDTPLDPHSPYEGFWWCHCGWLLDNEVRPPIPSPLPKPCQCFMAPSGGNMCAVAMHAPCCRVGHNNSCVCSHRFSRAQVWPPG
jgi:stearoyl-CoA desaturase (Delta-9 desaturase)